MRRYQCIIPFTGALHEVHVPPAPSTGHFTVDSLLRQLPHPEYQQQSGVPFRIDVLTTGSPSFGPPRGLGNEEALPDPADELCHLILLFDVKYLDRFPPVKIDSAAALVSHQTRQTVAFKNLLSPLHQYLEQTRGDFDRATTFVRAINDELVRSVAVMPASMDVLRSMPLVNAEVTLADRVGDVGSTIQAGWEELSAASHSLKAVEDRLVDIERRYSDEVNREAAAAEPTASGWEALRREVQNRIATLKALLKSTDAGRKEVVRAVEAIKAVRDGVLIKVLMINSLPEAYQAGIELAKRRLVFNKASARVRQMLSIEHAALCEAISAFVQKYGPRFPTNLIPGIHSKPTLPVFEDPVADFIRDSPSVQSFDEDPASELLVSLGLLRRIEGCPSQTSLSDESSSRFRDQLNDVATRLDMAHREIEDLRRQLEDSDERTKATERQHRAQLDAVTSLHQSELDALRQTNNQLALRLELAQQRSASASPSPSAAAVLGPAGVVDSASLLRQAERQRVEAQREAAEARTKASELAVQLTVAQDELKRKSAEWEGAKAAFIAKIEELQSSSRVGLGTIPRIADFFAAECANSQLLDKPESCEKLFLQMQDHTFEFSKTENKLMARWGEWKILAEDNDKNLTALKSETPPRGTLLMIANVSREGVIKGPVSWSC